MLRKSDRSGILYPYLFSTFSDTILHPILRGNPFMRRPLCAVCFAISILVAVLLLAFPVTLPSFESHRDDTVTVTGTVLSKEYRTDKFGKTTLRITLGSIASEDFTTDELRDIHKILCDFSQEDVPVPPMKSRVCITGTFVPFSPAGNHGTFDAAKYYSSLGISFRLKGCAAPSVLRRGSPPAEASYRFRRFLSGRFDACLPAHDASVMKAMLLGEKGYLDTDTKSLYKSGGIIHVLSISGLHIGILASGLYNLLRKLRCSHAAAAIPSVLLAFLYGFMTGMSLSTLRAISMFALHMLARMLRRTYDLVTAISIVGTGMLLTQPLYLYHSGFLFSFGAVMAIACFLPALDGKVMKTVGLPLATLPIYLGSSYTFPIYSILLNLVVIPLMTVLVPAGLIVLLLGSLFVPLGTLAGFVVRAILFLYENLCLLSEYLPAHNLILGFRPIPQLALYIVLLALLIVLKCELPYLIKWLWLAAALMWITVSPVTPGLSIHFIDVGQGDGILLQYRGRAVMIDGGSSDQRDLATYQLTPLLQYYGISHLDACIITHEDSDHMSGVLSLMQETRETGISIGTVILPAISEGSRGDNYKKILQTAKQAGIGTRFIGVTDHLAIDDLSLVCLSPVRDQYYADPNDTSVVLLLTYHDFSALLTGDLESGPCEDAALDAFLQYKASSPLPLSRISLLKCAHHGSSGASSAAFLQQVKPVHTVISCGLGNRYGHPHKETLDRLAAVGTTVWDTRYCGEITVTTDGKNMKIARFKSQ